MTIRDGVGEPLPPLPQQNMPGRDSPGQIYPLQDSPALQIPQKPLQPGQVNISFQPIPIRKKAYQAIVISGEATQIQREYFIGGTSIVIWPNPQGYPNGIGAGSFFWFEDAQNSPIEIPASNVDSAGVIIGGPAIYVGRFPFSKILITTVATPGCGFTVGAFTGETVNDYVVM